MLLHDSMSICTHKAGKKLALIKYEPSKKSGIRGSTPYIFKSSLKGTVTHVQYNTKIHEYHKWLVSTRFQEEQHFISFS